MPCLSYCLQAILLRRCSSGAKSSWTTTLFVIQYARQITALHPQDPQQNQQQRVGRHHHQQQQQWKVSHAKHQRGSPLCWMRWQQKQLGMPMQLKQPANKVDKVVVSPTSLHPCMCMSTLLMCIPTETGTPMQTATGMGYIRLLNNHRARCSRRNCSSMIHSSICISVWMAQHTRSNSSSGSQWRHSSICSSK